MGRQEINELEVRGPDYRSAHEAMVALKAQNENDFQKERDA